MLSKTLAYLQTKRADLEPKPGFMRQLVALDNSLQRVSRAAARGKEDPSLRKCSEWDPELVLGAWASGRWWGARTLLPPRPKRISIFALTLTPLPLPQTLS